MKQIELLNRELSMDPGQPHRLETHGLIADLALNGGYRFTQPFEGLPKVEEIKETALSTMPNLPGYDPELVDTYVDEQGSSRPYVSLKSALRFAKLSHDQVKPSRMRYVFQLIEHWCPVESQVQGADNAPLGIELSALPGIAETIAAKKPAKTNFAGMSGGIRVTAVTQDTFAKFVAAVLTPPAEVK